MKLEQTQVAIILQMHRELSLPSVVLLVLFFHLLVLLGSAAVSELIDGPVVEKAFLHIDSKKIDQVVQNLISNAVWSQRLLVRTHYASEMYSTTTR